MDIHAKLAVLKRIYDIYDDFIGDREIACEKRCARCCTGNVTLTTLEGYAIAAHLLPGGKADLLEKLKKGLTDSRFRPKLTTNRLAELCAEGEDFKEDDADPSGTACPLLNSDECPVYAVRPFICRCMVSTTDCRKTGYADVDPFVVSVNTLFLQTIEHVDSAGFSGNLCDVLLFLAPEDNRRRYGENTLGVSGTELVSNHPMKILMIPPEHRERMTPILRALRDIRV